MGWFVIRAICLIGIILIVLCVSTEKRNPAFHHKCTKAMRVYIDCIFWLTSIALVIILLSSNKGTMVIFTIIVMCCLIIGCATKDMR